MLLTIDAGNTNIVMAILDGQRVTFKWRMPTDPELSSKLFLKHLQIMIKEVGTKKTQLDDAIISSVVPPINETLIYATEKLVGKPPMMVGDANVDLGITIDTDDPSEVGEDRLVNAISGYHIYGGPLIILDCGTATTFDVVSKQGDYLGGVICPGINLSLDALSKATAKLPKLEVKVAYRNPITGKNTKDAMHSGIYWGYIGLIEGLVVRLRAEHGNEVRVIGTGGLVDLFAKNTEYINHVERDLTPKGLQLIYERNKK